MSSEYIYDITTDALQASEEIARSIDLRSRESVILEIFAPTTSAFALLITRRAWRSLSKRFPQILLTTSLSIAPLVGTTASTGVGVPAAAAALSAAEVAAIAYFFTSELASIFSLVADFPSRNEATAYLPAASFYDLISTDPEVAQAGFIPVSKELVSFGALYCCHFSEDVPATSATKTRLYASLVAGWLTGFTPAPVVAFCTRARNRLSNYVGSNVDAIVNRFYKDVLFVTRYSGVPLKRLPLGMKVLDAFSITYNVGVASFNTASALCRTLDCKASSVIMEETVNFILSPSSVTWRLPFTTQPLPVQERYNINFIDIEAVHQSSSNSVLTTNQIVKEADRLLEVYNEK